LAWPQLRDWLRRWRGGRGGIVLCSVAAETSSSYRGNCGYCGVARRCIPTLLLLLLLPKTCRLCTLLVVLLVVVLVVVLVLSEASQMVLVLAVAAVRLVLVLVLVLVPVLVLVASLSVPPQFVALLAERSVGREQPTPPPSSATPPFSVPSGARGGARAWAAAPMLAAPLPLPTPPTGTIARVRSGMAVLVANAGSSLTLATRSSTSPCDARLAGLPSHSRSTI
jgi:hypothetical protein